MLIPRFLPFSGTIETASTLMTTAMTAQPPPRHSTAIRTQLRGRVWKLQQLRAATLHLPCFSSVTTLRLTFTALTLTSYHWIGCRCDSQTTKRFVWWYTPQNPLRFRDGVTRLCSRQSIVIGCSVLILVVAHVQILGNVNVTSWKPPVRRRAEDAANIISVQVITRRQVFFVHLSSSRFLFVASSSWFSCVPLRVDDSKPKEIGAGIHSCGFCVRFVRGLLKTHTRATLSDACSEGTGNRPTIAEVGHQSRSRCPEWALHCHHRPPPPPPPPPLGRPRTQ